jgi:hypothetical protein
MPAKKPMAEWKHGTHGTYVNGCRCDDCRAASAAYKRELYHRNLAKARTYCREKMRRYARGRSHGDESGALVARHDALQRARASATGELADLIREQTRDDTPWVTRHPLIVRSFDESRWRGWGEHELATE